MKLTSYRCFYIACIHIFCSKCSSGFVAPASWIEKSSSMAIGSSLEQNTFFNEDDGAQKRTYLDDGFVFGLEGSGISRPKGKTAQLVVEGDNLETMPWQVAVVCFTFLGNLSFAMKSFLAMLDMNNGDFFLTSIQAVSLATISWMSADLGSGILHWSVDNYGNGSTPIMGGVIAAFQGHHSAPWTITERSFCNNVYKLCIPFGVLSVGIVDAVSDPYITLFFSLFCVTEILSQEFHKWSHMTKGQCPNWVNTLQNIGLIIGRKPHAQHHNAPYDGNYCIVSGVWNEVLDDSGFFRRLEHLIYEYNGVESNAWKLDQDLKERTLRSQYRQIQH